MPGTPNPNYTPSERAEIIAQFQEPSDFSSENPTKMYELTPDWLKTEETYGTRTSTKQKEIPEPTDKAWPFVNYLTYGKIPASPLPPGKSYPYYRNLVEKFGRKLPPKLEDKLKALHIPKNPAAESAFAHSSPAPSGSLIPDTPATSFKYTGNYFEILTHLIPEEKSDPNSKEFDPDFHYINMHDAIFKNIEIDKKPGFNSDGRFTTVPTNVTVPRKPKDMGHDEYMDKLYDKGILVYPAEHQSMKGHQRAKRLRKVVQNLFKLTIKMDNFSELSEVSRQQQVTIEEYALTTRKMFYILTFLKDQMKLIDQQEAELEDLITAMTAKTQQFERLLGKKQFNKYRQKTIKLKKDKKAIESLTKYATESILRRFKKMGISVDGVTDLDGPLPGDASNSIRWDTFKQLFDNDMVGDSELTRLKSEYMQAIQGRGERLHLLLKFPLPGSKKLSELPQTKREALKVFLENAFDSLTAVPIDEGYEMLTSTDYKSIGMTGGSENNVLSISIDSDSKNNNLVKNMFAGALDIDEHDVAVVNYNNLYGGEPSTPTPTPSGNATPTPTPNENATPTPTPNSGTATPSPTPTSGTATPSPTSGTVTSTPTSGTVTPTSGTSSSETGSEINPSQTGTRLTEDGFVLYLQGLSPSRRADEDLDGDIKEKYKQFLNDKGISIDMDKIEIIDGYDDTPITSSEDSAATPVGGPTPPAGTPTSSPAGTPTSSPTGTPTSSPAGTPTSSPAGAPTSSPAGAPTSSPAGSRGGRLVGGDIGLGIKVNGLTPSDKAKAKQIVAEGEIPDDLRETYNLYLSRPEPMPGKTLNLPYEPSEDEHLEVVIKLPNDPVKKQQVLHTFGKKQILTRLKQNLAARLGNYKEYQSEYKDIKDLLHNMATNSKWITDMKIESLGETSGIKVNPDQPTQHWKDTKDAIQQFNTKLMSSISPSELSSVGSSTSPWWSDVTEGTEGHISKGLFDISKFDDEIADKQSGEMFEYKINFADEVFSVLNTPEKRKSFLQSLGIDPSKIKNPEGDAVLQNGGRRSKKNTVSKNNSKKNRKTGGAGVAIFRLDFKDIKDRIEAAKASNNYTFKDEDGTVFRIERLRNAIENKLYDPEGEEKAKKDARKAANQAAEASRRAAQEAAKAAEEIQKKVTEAQNDTSEIEFTEADENIHLSQATALICMMVEKKAPEQFIKDGIQKMADSATPDSLKQAINNIDITKCTPSHEGGYIKAGGYRNLKRKSNKRHKYLIKKQLGGDNGTLKIPGSFLKFLDIQPAQLAEKTKEFTNSHQDIVKNAGHIENLPTPEQFESLKPSKIPCACDHGDVVAEANCPDQGGQQCEKCDESQSYELVEEGDYKKCIQKPMTFIFMNSGEELKVEGVLKHETLQQVLEKAKVSDWYTIGPKLIISKNSDGSMILKSGDNLGKKIGELNLSDNDKFDVSEAMDGESCVKEAKNIIGVFAKWDTGIRNILKGWVVKIEPDEEEKGKINSLIDDLNNQGNVDALKTMAGNPDSIDYGKVNDEVQKIKEAMKSHITKITAAIEAREEANAKKFADITEMLNKPPSRNKSANPPGIPIEERLVDYYDKLGEFAGYTRSYLSDGVNLYDPKICVALSNIVTEMKGKKAQYTEWSARMADDLEDIGGSVRTVVKYRDHHLSSVEYPIVQARMRKKDAPTFSGEQWPTKGERGPVSNINIPTCILVDDQGGTLQKRIKCEGNETSDPYCSGDKKQETIAANKEKCNYLVTPGITTGRTRFYGPYADVFDENNSNFDVYQRMEAVFDQLSRGYNVTIFGFGFSGSGKTYTLLGQSSSDKDKGITQQAIAALSTKPGVGEILCKVRELAPGHTHSRVIYYKPVGEVEEFEPSTDKNPSWKWTVGSDGNIKQKTTTASKLDQGTTFEEVDYDTYKTYKGFTIKPDDIDNLVEKITMMRVNTLRISGTPNNPQSSRGHLFLEFIIKFGANTGKLTICDMAGSENTKEIKDTFFKSAMKTSTELQGYNGFSYPMFYMCPGQEECLSVAATGGKKGGPDAEVYAQMTHPKELSIEKATERNPTKAKSAVNNFQKGGRIEFIDKNTQKLHDRIKFYFPHKANKFDPSYPFGQFVADSPEIGEAAKKMSGIADRGPYDVCPTSSGKVFYCKGMESFYRNLWVKYGIVFKGKDAKNGFDYDKYGYYEASIWSKELHKDFHLDVSKLDKGGKKKWEHIDVKKTYYNSMDIWSQFYLKFMFGNQIKKEHFYHCLPIELDGFKVDPKKGPGKDGEEVIPNAIPPHPKAEAEKVKAKYIFDSIQECYDTIYGSSPDDKAYWDNGQGFGNWHKDSNDGKYLQNNPSGLKVDPSRDDYVFPDDGGIDKIQIASELKTKLILPLFNGKKSVSNTTFIPITPQDITYHRAGSLGTMDTFLAVNGLVSPFDIEVKGEDASNPNVYYIPSTSTLNQEDTTRTLDPINKVIAIFDGMVKKIEPMSGKELAMKKQWVLLRDMYIVSDACKWEKSKDDIISPLNKLFTGTSPSELFNPIWLAGKKDSKFKKLELVFKPEEGLSTKEHSNGGDIEFKNIQYLYSAINNFILNYITIIVYQGDGIVATLDHLATYFRYNSFDPYGKKSDNLETCVEIDGPGTMRYTIPADENQKKEKVVKGEPEYPYKLPPGGKEMPGWDIGVTKINPVKDADYPGSRGVRMAERPRDAAQRFLMYNTLKSLDDPNSISKYIMLTCILRGEQTGSTQGKYCKAAKDTLEFAQKVASTANSCLCEMGDTKSIAEGETQAKKDSDRCSSRGGGRRVRKRSLKKKKYMKANNKRTMRRRKTTRN